MRLYFPLLIAVLLLPIRSVPAQTPPGPVLPLDEDAYRLLMPLYARGTLDINPHIGPWSGLALQSRTMTTELDSELARPTLTLPPGGGTPLERALVSRLSDYLIDAPASDVYWGVRLRPGIRAATQERLDVLRSLPERTASVYPYALVEAFLVAGRWTANFGLRHDLYYDQDPDGQDAAHRLYTRPENTYVRYDGSYVQAFLGRMSRHWGRPGSPGLILTDNARPIDHLALTVGPRRLHVQATLSELDRLPDPAAGTGTPPNSPHHRRYLAAHRLTIGAGDWWITLMHAVLYSDPSAGLSLKFLNPFNMSLFSVEDPPKNEENNGLIGVDVSGRQGRTSAHIQVMLDDFDVLGGEEPISIAGTADLTHADVLPGADLFLEATLVTSRTYNALQAPGKYMYLGRGIGTQYSDFISATARLDMMGWFERGHVIVSPGASVLFQGSQDFRMPFPPNDGPGALLDGIVERTVRPFVDFLWAPPGGVSLSASAGYNVLSNAGWISGQNESHFSGGLHLSWRWSHVRGL